ncbi:MAG TPA: ABC transporter permease [Acidimicrobiales bacterium]|jgi:ABC-2 type transport system permease protein|nr:ABC transporter permease [Acidimicrobiales bacterium]
MAEAATTTRRHLLPRDVRLVVHQVRYEQLAFWLNRVGAIFTVVFSVLFLVMLGASAGQSRVPALGNIKLIVYYVPGFVAYGIMSACFTTLAINLVVRRETGQLKRLRLSPLPARVLLVAIFVSTAIVSLVQVVLLLIIGRFGYSVHLPVSWAAFALVLLVGIVSFSAMGVAISTVIPNQETAGPVTSIIFFVLLFLAGLWFPLGKHSGLAKFSNYFPVLHFIKAIDAPFKFQPGVSPWAWHDILIIALWGAGSVLVALRKFKWSPRRS